MISLRDFHVILAGMTFLMLLATGAAAEPGQRYIGALFGSQHVGNDNLNNKTPGITFGKRVPRGNGRETFLEAGVFYNSYKEISPVFITGMTWHIATIGHAEIRGGGGIGTAYYGELSESLKADHGIPNIGGFIPIAALTASVRFDEVELRLTTVPPDSDTDFILNFGLTFPF